MKYPIELELTDHCLLKCNYCPNKTYKNKWFMTFDMFTFIVDYLFDNIDQILFLDLSWIGDIFLHPDINIFLLYLSDKFTNTWLDILIPTKWNSINDGHISTLKICYEKWLKINLSIWIYSLRSMIHDKISWVDNFEKIILFIRKIKSEKLPFTLELLVNKDSIKELNYFYRFWDKLGVNYKIHNYHNFSWSIKWDKLEHYNSDKYKLNCSFADEEIFNWNFHCKYTMPFISKDWYLYSCTHWWKQNKYKLENVNILFNKYKQYNNLLEYIENKIDRNICKDCTYINYI